MQFFIKYKFLKKKKGLMRKEFPAIGRECCASRFSREGDRRENRPFSLYVCYCSLCTLLNGLGIKLSSNTQL